MITLDPKHGHTTLINTFEVEPERAEALIQVLEEATETMKRMSGFVLVNLHLSRDKTRVGNSAQWASVDDLQAMLQNPEAQPHMKTAADLAKSYEPVLYSLEYSGGR